MSRYDKWFFAGAGMAAVGILGFAYCRTSRNLMRLAFDREQPRWADRKKRRMVADEEKKAVEAAMERAAEALINGDLETVALEGYDGVRLTGHWYCPENPKRVIVAMHGWRSSWAKDFGAIAPFWQENGCAVLYAEQRGQGRSDGEYMTFGLLERHDCLSWARWVIARTGGRLPVYLGGVSMGATTVLMTGGLPLPEQVRGIVADCAFTSPHAIWKHVMERGFHLPYRLYSRRAEGICKKKIRASPQDSTMEALRKCTVPVLLIHGADDRFVPAEMSYENYRACSAPKRLLIVPGAGHGMSYLVDKAAYETALKDFWNQYDSL